MHSAFKPVVRTLVMYLLSVLAVGVVLMAGIVAVEGLQDFRRSSGDVQALAGVQAELAQYRRQQEVRLTEQLGAADRLPLAAVDRRIGALTRQLQAGPPSNEIDLHALLRGGAQAHAGQLARHYRAELDRALAAQELAYLQQLRARLVMRQGRAEAEREAARLRAVHEAAYRRYLEKKREQDRLGQVERRLMEREWTMTPALRRLASEVAARHAENERAALANRAQQLALHRMGTLRELRPFTVDAAALERAVRPLDEFAADVRGAVSAHPFSRIAGLLPLVLPAAFALPLLCVGAKYLLRTFLYFMLAPLVTRGRALRFDEAGSAPGIEQPGQAAELACPSAVSQTIRLDPAEELLVLPGYLQSTPVAAVKSTRWLAQGRMSASLASGMVLLTCVRTASRDQHVVLSAGDGGLGELALIRVPAGAALVFQPRALVGLVCNRDVPLQVERRWRLASLHAWLTLQLRYFLIRGPVTLIVQGRRGVRVQQADGSHLVRQAATLGFSADVAYSTLRSAPFLPYLRGHTDLLYDRFAGGRGIYVYDETADAGGKGGRARRGLEGLGDAVLKVVGL